MWWKVNCTEPSPFWPGLVGSGAAERGEIRAVAAATGMHPDTVGPRCPGGGRVARAADARARLRAQASDRDRPSCQNPPGTHLCGSRRHADGTFDYFFGGRSPASVGGAPERHDDQLALSRRIRTLRGPPRGPHLVRTSIRWPRRR
jgi:hypothetical protein